MDLTPLEPWIAHKIGCPTERPSRADIAAYQLRQAQETLRLARQKSQFYRRHLAHTPQEISDLADLVEFPFTSPANIRANALQFLCVSQSDIQRVVTLDSSGTTGEPKRLYFTKEDQELTLDFFHIGMSTFTGAGDRVLILLPGERSGSIGDLLVMALPRLGAVGIKHGPVRDVALTLEVMAREKVTGLVGLPTHVLALVRCSQAKSKMPPPALKSILLTADHVPETIKAVVERAWGSRVYNHYGMTEMGLGGGVECQARRGYHLREADLYVEIIDPITGKPVAEGDDGEVVFTTLTRRGMPLIRYRTGDLSRFIPGDCPCGAVLKTLAPIKSRTDGRLKVGEDGYLTIADLDEALFPIEAVLDFSAVMTHEEKKDYLQLEIRPVEGVSHGLDIILQKAIETIPAIRRACQNGKLEVRLLIQTGGWVGDSSPAKRTIVDKRKIGVDYASF